MRILVAEDDPDSAQLLEWMLRRWDYDVVSVADGRTALDALSAPDGPKLAILDWMMPGMDGPEVCRRLRQLAAPYVYVILLTARGNSKDVVAGLRQGADDFLLKPFDADELHARLGTGRRILELQQALLDAQGALRFDATHDHLTGVNNRATIIERLLGEMERGTRTGGQTAVVFADLDHFKSFNDTYGHPVGDQVLVEAVERMRSSIRPYDVLGRYGGEEFLVILPECGRAMAARLAERIRERVAAEPVRINGTSLPLTVSLGVAACFTKGRQHTSPEALIAAADAALYRAKAEGRNRVSVATEDEVEAAVALEAQGALLLSRRAPD